MRPPREAVRLTIHLGESDRHAGRPLYEALVLRARELRLAGATVLRGPMGYGANSHLHTQKVLRLSEDLPMQIVIVDARERVDAFLGDVDGWLGDTLVTLEEVTVVRGADG